MMGKMPHKEIEKEKSQAAFCLLKESIKNDKTFHGEVVSGSMFPLLEIGDKLSIKDISINDLKNGDIIVYRLNDYLCVHRYIYKLRINNDSFRLLTKADILTDLDPWSISCEELFGKVISVKKRRGEINLETVFLTP